MKTIVTLLLLSLLSFSVTLGQMLETDSISQAEISRLGFMVGKWKGSGWIMGRDQQQQNFEQTEDVQFKLDQTLLLIEGLGKSDGRVSHSALAVVSFNKQDKHYNFQSYLADGRSGNLKAELIGEKLYWYPMDNIRYLIYINDEGQWHETGEMNRNGQWFQFFEMTLEKL
jgi:hypothetical protein